MLSTNKKFADVYRKEGLLVYRQSNKFASATKSAKKTQKITEVAEKAVMLLHRTRFFSCILILAQKRHNGTEKPVLRH